MFDVSLHTRKLENDDIKLLTINTLNFQIGITKEEIKFMNNKVLQSINKDNCSFIQDDTSYLLVNRKKGEKFSINQITFLKSMLSDSSLKKNKRNISCLFIIVLSFELNKKIQDLLININNKRNFTKIYGFQKQKLLKMIIEYINKTRLRWLQGDHWICKFLFKFLVFNTISCRQSWYINFKYLFINIKMKNIDKITNYLLSDSEDVFILH